MDEQEQADILGAAKGILLALAFGLVCMLLLADLLT
jgi:hypothetical protein